MDRTRIELHTDSFAYRKLDYRILPGMKGLKKERDWMLRYGSILGSLLYMLGYTLQRWAFPDHECEART